jgi:hypothetical protein
MSVSCKCCVLSVRGLCDQLVPRPEESYRVWCVSTVCDHKTSTKRGGPAPYKAVEPYKENNVHQLTKRIPVVHEIILREYQYII